MTSSQRSALVGGIILIGLGILFLLGQLAPGLFGWLDAFSWPLIIVAGGALFLIIGILTNTPGLAVPACIIGGIGLLLYWQNQTGNWDSWAYAWALIPGFVGVGTVLMGLWQGKWDEVRGGLWLMVISALLFVVFGAFLGGLFGGGFSFIGKWWPLALIALGVLSLIDVVSKRRTV
jgi:hypothetical protein